MSTITTDRCLMIEMNDRRRIFTERDNLMSLIEFARTFNARVSLVEGKEIELFSLDELPVVICDGSYKHRGQYTALETVLPRDTIFTAARPRKGCRPRRDAITLAQTIRSFVRTSLLGHQTITLKLLKDKYRESGLGESCLSGHLNLVKRSMEGEGFQIERLARGSYRLGNS